MGILSVLILVSGLIAIGLAIGGFVRFTNHVASLKTPQNIESSDGIVVLTGGHLRIEAALELLEQRKGNRLLISGVNPNTSASAIRRQTASTSRLFECCVDLGREAQDTVGNAQEAVDWINRNGFKTIILVTNNYHVPRSLLELRRAREDADIRVYPVVNTDLTDGEWITDPEIIRVLLLEYTKLVVAGARDFTGSWRRTAL